MSWTFAPGPGARERTRFPRCPVRGPRRAIAETGYAASDFFAGELSDFFESDFDESDFEESDFDESDLDSAFSLPDRSISRLRRFVP
jgi:hypothetical protein